MCHNCVIIVPQFADVTAPVKENIILVSYSMYLYIHLLVYTSIYWYMQVYDIIYYIKINPNNYIHIYNVKNIMAHNKFRSPERNGQYN